MEITCGHSVAAPSRCHPEFDTGRTKAPPNTRTFCLHFAHGACNKGYECQFLHKIPTLDDPVETTIDAFGRDRFREQKGDMGGIGSFDRENRTLYVGKIQCDRDEIENIVARHFGEFGKIQRCKLQLNAPRRICLPSRAFAVYEITYPYEKTSSPSANIHQ